jgi:hypothetical protein
MKCVSIWSETYEGWLACQWRLSFIFFFYVSVAQLASNGGRVVLETSGKQLSGRQAGLPDDWRTDRGLAHTTRKTRDTITKRMRLPTGFNVILFHLPCRSFFANLDSDEFASQGLGVPPLWNMAPLCSGDRHLDSNSQPSRSISMHTSYRINPKYTWESHQPKSHFTYWPHERRHGQKTTNLLGFCEVPGSNLRSRTCYSHWGFRGFP